MAVAGFGDGGARGRLRLEYAQSAVSASTTSTSHPPSARRDAISYLTVKDMPAGWVEVCGGADTDGQGCGPASQALGTKLVGQRSFQNSLRSPTESIAEEVFSFSSLRQAEAATSNLRGLSGLFGSKLIHVLTPMSVTGISADQVSGFTVGTGSSSDDFFLVRDDRTVAVFACTGGSFDLQLSAVLAAT